MLFSDRSLDFKADDFVHFIDGVLQAFDFSSIAIIL